jgi:hypothetical protein
MTRIGFVFLLAVTIATIYVASLVAERYAAPGLDRTLVVAFITACVVFPAGKLAEKLGWVRGNLDITSLKSPIKKHGSASAKPVPKDPT